MTLAELPARIRGTPFFAAAVMLVASGGCLGGGNPVRPAATPGRSGAAPAGRNGATAIVVDETLTRGDPEVMGTWLLYGVAMTGASTSEDPVAPYQAEVQGRTLLADSWKERRAGGKHDAYLDLLVDVREAGFIAEYTIAFLARPGWIVPGSDLGKLDLAGFRRWMPQHLPKDHRAATHVGVQGGAAVHVPGATLPSSSELDPRRVPCESLQPRLAAALARWDAEEAQLGHVALSASTEEQILPTFDWVARDARARRDGVVYVSPRVAETLFVSGFCALDRNAAAPAEKLLRRAVGLSPGNANVRGELVQTLILEKKLDDADAQLDEALKVAVSPCHVAMLWRKRGYILFDRGKLVDSYHAYGRSLEFDPGNDIARKEMNLIVTQLRRAGGFDEKALGSFPPPPPGEMRVTKCR